MTFFLMMQKEWKEQIKTYRLLFVPVLFAILMVMQPISTKMLPELLKNSESLPPGTVIEIATPSAVEVIATVVSKTEMLFALILILITMGAVSSERLSGVAAMVLVKPVGRAKYFFAKATSYSLLAIVSFFAGMMLSAYYTEMYFGDLDWGNIVQGSIAYFPNIVMIIALTLFGSSFIKSPVGAGGLALVLYFLLTMVPQYFEAIKSYTPGELSANVVNILVGKSYEITEPLIGVSVIAIGFLVAGWYLLEKQEI